MFAPRFVLPLGVAALLLGASASSRAGTDTTASTPPTSTMKVASDRSVQRNESATPPHPHRSHAIDTSPAVATPAAAATPPAVATPPDSTSTVEVPGTLDAPIPLFPDSTGTRYIAPVQEVRGDRPDRQKRHDRLPPTATVLEQDAWAHRGLTAPEVLASAAGLSLRSTGGLGASAQVSLRGSSSAQVPVYLDGLPLNRPDRGGADVGNLNLASLERIEVYRGSAPLVLGGASLGGAIHLRSATTPSPLRASITSRSYGAWIGDAAISHDLGAWTLDLRLRALRADNDWSYLDDRGTLYNSADDERRPRRNNDVRGGGALVRAARRWGQGRLHASTMLDAQEQGLPGLSVLSSDDARGEAVTSQTQFGWTSDRLAATRLREVSVFGRFERQRYIDLDGDFRRIAHDRRDDVVTLGAQASGALAAYGERFWRAEALWSQIDSDDRALLDGDGAPQSRWTLALAAQPNLRFLDDRLLLSPGLRVERNFQRLHESNAQGGLPAGERSDLTTDAFTAQVGLRYSLDAHLHLRANLGAYERIPTLLELFGDRGAVMGNPELASEHGINRDIGIVFRDRDLRLAITVFDNDAFDLISLVQNSPVSVRYQNVGRAQMVGTEVETSLRPHRRLQWTTSVTRLLTRDRSDRSYAKGAPLPGRPGLVLVSRAQLLFGRLSSEFSVSALGDDFAQTGGRAPIPSRTLWSVGARYALTDGLAVLGRIHNLTDREVFDLYGYPLPGRQFSLTLQAGLDDAR